MGKLINKSSVKHLQILLKLNKDSTITNRENSNLEFKEQFSLSGLADYFKDFAGFANHSGGYLVFGISNAPRKIVGLSNKSSEQFEKLDPERIAGNILEIFSQSIEFDQISFIHKSGKRIGAFYIKEAVEKPIIAKKDEGKGNVIQNGDIYYRYAGRTQKIQFGELENIIKKRIESNNTLWLSQVKKIAKAGPGNTAILDTEKGLLEKDGNNVLVIDKELLKEIKFIREGSFSVKKGKTTLKLVGEVKPINTREITKYKEKNILELYPLTHAQLVEGVKKTLPNVKQGNIYKAIKENNLKNNKDYSTYNFRSKKQEDEYIKTGTIPKGIPSIFNTKSVAILIKILKK